MNKEIDWCFLDLVCDAVKEAGHIIESIANEGFDTAYKERQDPVTNADRAANDFLHERLLHLLPDAGWLSEETRDNDERLTKDYVWIVDPIDGTKEFIDRVPHYAVSVALIYHSQLILGVVYNPSKNECFSALREYGAWLNAEPIRADYHETDKMRVLGSRTEINRGEFEPFAGHLEVVAVGSIAYKLALIAAGKANATFSLTPKNEWDIAAGVLLMEEAGGMITDKLRRPFVFNQSDTLVNGVIASTKASYYRMIQLIDSLIKK